MAYGESRFPPLAGGAADAGRTLGSIGGPRAGLGLGLGLGLGFGVRDATRLLDARFLFLVGGRDFFCCGWAMAFPISFRTSINERASATSVVVRN
jgi:hypothetical protein